jgi:hypothetical protein
METERIAFRQRERERLGVLQEVKRKQPTQMGGSAIPTITSLDQAQAFVDACIAEGSDCIKIIYDDGSRWTWTTTRVPMLDTAILRALVTAAHKRGKPAVVPCFIGTAGARGPRSGCRWLGSYVLRRFRKFRLRPILPSATMCS